MKIVIIECYIALMAVLTTVRLYMKPDDVTGVDLSVWTAAVMLAWLMRLRNEKK